MIYLPFYGLRIWSTYFKNPQKIGFVFYCNYGLRTWSTSLFMVWGYDLPCFSMFLLFSSLLPSFSRLILFSSCSSWLVIFLLISRFCYYSSFHIFLFFLDLSLVLLLLLWLGSKTRKEEKGRKEGREMKDGRKERKDMKKGNKEKKERKRKRKEKRAKTLENTVF